MKNRSKKGLAARTAAMMLSALILFSGCGQKTDSGLLSEGVDTPVTITGRSSFGNRQTCFLEEGDRVAVIAPSKPDPARKGYSENGCGHVPVRA